MKSKISISLILLFISSFLIYIFKYSDARLQDYFSNNKSSEVGKADSTGEVTLKGASFRDLNNQEINFDKIKNKVVVLNFWASWCEPCIKEVPSLIKFSKKFKNDLVVIAISGDQELSEVTAFLKSFPELQSENSVVVFEKEKLNFNFFKINKLPESLIFNREHKFIRKISGSIDWDSEDVTSYFKSVVL